jgi:hypothetical protein
MEITANSKDSKERRSNSCLDRSLLKINQNRTSSFNEQSKLNRLIFSKKILFFVLDSTKMSFDSSTESIERYSTPKHELYKVRTNFTKKIEHSFFSYKNNPIKMQNDELHLN